MVVVEDVEGGVLIKTDSDKGIRTGCKYKDIEMVVLNTVFILSDYTS